MPNAPVLDRLTLNRTLLARQHLLHRASMPVEAMLEHLVGMQAQVPRNPYLALWSRVEGFRPAELERLVENRAALRMSTLRCTLHLVSADDALATRPVLQRIHERGFAGSPFQKQLTGLDVAELTAAGGAMLDGDALTTRELGSRLHHSWPDRDPSSLAYAIRYLVPVVQVPPRGLWSRSAQPRWRTLESWLGRPMEMDTPPDGLVLRYLRAFGPASVADIATWSWLTGVREIVDRLRPSLRVFLDHRGVELVDVEDGEIADPDEPAPPRFLPEFDNLMLSHADRSRVVDRAFTARFDGYAGAFLLDGFVAGKWRVERGAGAHRLILESFIDLSDDQASSLTAEAGGLLTWMGPDGPEPAAEITFGTVSRPAGLSNSESPSI